jgi:type IV pilus assembly protein PilM
MIQVARFRGQIAAIACRQRSLPPGPLSNDERRRLQVASIAEMLATGGFVGREVMTALPWGDLRIQPLRFPTKPTGDTADLIQAEAVERLGLEPNRAQVRFTDAGDVRQGTDILHEVIAMATTAQAIEDRLALLDEVGLVPVAIDSAPCAVFRGFERFLLRREDTHQVHAFVDLGYSGSRVIVTRGDQLVHVKPIPIGGAHFEVLIGKQLDLTVEETVVIRDRLRRTHGAGPGGSASTHEGDNTVGMNMHHAILEAIRPALRQLAKEISLCLRYCAVTFRGLQSETMTAIGGEALNPGILRVLSDHADMPFQLGRPMRQIALDLHPEGINRRGGQPDWATAVGLALKPVAPHLSGVVA